MALPAFTLLAFAAAVAEPPALTLEDALAELDRANPSLELSRRRAEEASAAARASAAASLPSLTATGSYTRNSDQAVAPLGALAAVLLPPGAAGPRDLVIQPLEAFQGTLSARVPLLAPQAWAEASAARSTARAATASSGATRAQLRTALVQAAALARAGEEVVAAWERAERSAREQAESAARARAAGTGTPLAQLRAETEAVRRESEVVRARAELERARLATGVLLGRGEPVRVILPTATSTSTPTPTPTSTSTSTSTETLATTALSRRPELAAQEAQRTAAERARLAARARWLPTLGATGSAFASDVPYPTGQKDGWRVVVDLSWALWDGGLREARNRQASAALAGAEASLAQQRLDVRREVEDAARDVRVAEERLRLADQQRRLAAEADASARRAQAAGVASALEVLDASDRLAQAEVALADARARTVLAAAALDRAAGLP